MKEFLNDENGTYFPIKDSFGKTVGIGYYSELELPVSKQFEILLRNKDFEKLSDKLNACITEYKDGSQEAEFLEEYKFNVIFTIDGDIFLRADIMFYDFILSEAFDELDDDVASIEDKLEELCDKKAKKKGFADYDAYTESLKHTYDCEMTEEDKKEAFMRLKSYFEPKLTDEESVKDEKAILKACGKALGIDTEHGRRERIS